MSTFALAPRNLGEAQHFAAQLSQTDFAPREFRGKPEAVLMCIVYGSELGFTPMQSLQNIAIINGKPTVYGDGLVAVVRSSGLLEYMMEQCDQDEAGEMVATCEVQRKGEPSPQIRRFSQADAKRAKLWGKSGPWSQYPQRMLQMRARSWALRDVFGDLLRGMACAEEMADVPSEPVEVVRHEVQQDRPEWMDMDWCGQVDLRAEVPRGKLKGQRWLDVTSVDALDVIADSDKATPWEKAHALARVDQLVSAELAAPTEEPTEAETDQAAEELRKSEARSVHFGKRLARRIEQIEAHLFGSARGVGISDTEATEAREWILEHLPVEQREAMLPFDYQAICMRLSHDDLTWLKAALEQAGAELAVA